MTCENGSNEGLREDAGHLQNEVRTCEPRDALLTQRRSRRVRKRPASPEAQAIIALRGKIGADTPAGHACSDIVENFKNLDTAKAVGSAFQLSKLAVLMPERVEQLAEQLTKGE